jgi:hypothetical protein
VVMEPFGLFEGWKCLKKSVICYLFYFLSFPSVRDKVVLCVCTSWGEDTLPTFSLVTERGGAGDEDPLR